MRPCQTVLRDNFTRSRFYELVGPRASRSWVCALVVLAASCAPQRELAHESLAIHNGQLETSYRGTVALIKNGLTYCSGVQISHSTVLTAAHCLPPNVPDLEIGQIRVHFDSIVEVTSTGFEVADALAHPGWQSEADAEFDIGILALADPLSTRGAPVATPAHGVEEIVGGLIAGYGDVDAGVGASGVLRNRLVDVEEITAGTISIGAEFGGVTCTGDSGGPFFAERGGVSVVVGLHSRSNCTSTAVETRVDNHYDDFIAPFVAASNPPECRADGECRLGCAVDPDCDCTADGACEENCTNDPDCAEWDPHTPFKPDIGGCSSGGGGSPIGLAVFVLLLVLRRAPVTKTAVTSR